MLISEVITALTAWAPPAYQESYDNCGLITGDANWNCTGILCSLDATEGVVDEAIALGYNMVVAHHPIVFGAIKKFSGNSYVEKTIQKAIRKDVAIYAIHTSLDNVSSGVNFAIAEKLGLEKKSLQILLPKAGMLSKLYTYVPAASAELLKTALFDAGGGQIGLYSECSFSTPGTGTFRPMEGSNPVIGQAGGTRELVEELKIEVIFPAYLAAQMVNALHQAHPYEVPAYEVISLQNHHQDLGSGMIGNLAAPISATELLELLRQNFGAKGIRHTRPLGKPIQKIALCGGAGSFLTKHAIRAGADAFITADLKYHEFFDAEDRLILVDIGHWESEQFTIELLANFLQAKFPTFAVLQTKVNTNPVHYFV
jgi:dinuclear metal center YbgI/SA1388 family protein